MTFANEQVNEELDELENQETEDSQTETEESPKVEIPEKFKDKSIEDIVEAYVNLEQEFGKRNNEVGQLRKLTDQLLNLELEQKKQTESAPEPEVDVSADDLLDNPKSTVDSLVENNPKIKQLENALTKTLRDQQKREFESQHPDWTDVVSSPEFQGWLAESPIRLKMFIEADKSYDYATGSELLTLFKSLKKASIDTTVEKDKEKRKEDLKASKTGSSGTGASSKKIYKRSDLIQLRISDPDRFNAMQDEILLAYQEGRVR